MRTERKGSARERGSVLLHVMVTGVLVAIIAAGILRMAMLRYQLAHRSALILQERRYDTAALAILSTQWNSAGIYCSSAGVYTCGPSSAPPLTSCACTCTTAALNYPPTVTGSGSPPACTLTITSTDLQ